MAIEELESSASVRAELNTALLKADKVAKPPTVQAGTTYTIDSDDDQTIIEFTNAALVTVTIPVDASDDLDDGYTVALFAAGAGGLTLSTAGITLSGSSPNVTIAQNEAIFLQKTTTADKWLVIGGTS